MKEVALKSCSPVAEIGDISSVEKLPYEALIASVIVFSQRSASGIGTVASLYDLPPQLTTNFPSFICSCPTEKTPNTILHRTEKYY